MQILLHAQCTSEGVSHIKTTTFDLPYGRESWKCVNNCEAFNTQQLSAAWGEGEGEGVHMFF